MACVVMGVGVELVELRRALRRSRPYGDKPLACSGGAPCVARSDVMQRRNISACRIYSRYHGDLACNSRRAAGGEGW